MHQENLLAALANPDIVLSLLALGVLGVCWELSRASLVVPGVAGSVLVVLALGSPAAGRLDVRGFVLLAVSLVCFVAEAATRSRGVLTSGGMVAMMAGLRMLDGRIGWVVALAAAIPFSLLISFLLSVAFAARRSKLGILGKGDTAHP